MFVLRWMRWLAVSTGCFIFLANPLEAQASFLRLVPDLKIDSKESSAGILQVAGAIENQGDETAHDVAIETIRGNKLLVTIGAMEQGAKKEISVEVPESELGVNEEGSYLLPLRVLYKDANKVPFSAAFIVSYFKKAASGALPRSSPITLGLLGGEEGKAELEIGTSGDFEIKLVNTSGSNVSVNLEFISSKEIEFKTKNSKIEIGGQKEEILPFTVRNVSALKGSSYATYALVTGSLDGQTFSDYIGFVVNVTARQDTPWLSYVLGIAFLFFIGIAVYFYRKEKANQADGRHKINPRTVVKGEPGEDDD